MVYNDPERPEIARERQDVESPPLRAEQFPHHTGRGMQLRTGMMKNVKLISWF